MRTEVKLVSNKPDEYITYDSIVDGPGIRCTIWFQGCSHHCKNCHNKNTWSFYDGAYVDIEDVKKEILKIAEIGYYDGITFSGGDPLYQIGPLQELINYCKSLGLNVWIYTGFTYEEIKDTSMLEYIKSADVLVDGQYDETKHSYNLLYRGSSNQRLINIQESINNNEIVLFE